MARGVSESQLNQHKEMAGAGQKGSFGVTAMPCNPTQHPDVGMSHMPMDDGNRGAGPGIGGGKSKMGMQAAPDHGPQGKDHFNRAGRL